MINLHGRIVSLNLKIKETKILINYIYCYTNKINGKKYVGQTNCLERRCREHKSNAFNLKSVNYDNIIHRAFRKYGFDNFDFEVLEELIDQPQELVNDREIYWIKEKRSLVSEHGYNVLEGGKNASRTALTQEQIDKIKTMLKEGKSYQEIKDTFGISFTFISNINYGKFFFDEKIKYPIYYHGIDDNVYKCLMEDLQVPELTFKALAEKYGIAESTVKKFNYGKLKAGFYDGEYPIRKITPTNYKAALVQDYLLNTNYTKKEIKEILKVSDECLRKINLGLSHHRDDIEYPIRPV